MPCSPYFLTNINGKNNLNFRTLILKELIKEKIFMPYISISGCHNDNNIKFIEKTFKKILPKLRLVINKKNKTYNIGRVVKPVFRKFN